MNYKDILDSIQAARTMEELIHRRDMWATALEAELCDYTDDQEKLLDTAIRHATDRLHKVVARMMHKAEIHTIH